MSRIVNAIFPGLKTVRLESGEMIKVDAEVLKQLKVGQPMPDDATKQEAPNVQNKAEVAAKALAVEIKAAQPAPAPKERREAPIQARRGEPLTQYDFELQERICVQGLAQALINSSLILDLKQLEPALDTVLEIVRRKAPITK